MFTTVVVNSVKINSYFDSTNAAEMFFELILGYLHWKSADENRVGLLDLFKLIARWMC